MASPLLSKAPRCISCIRRLSYSLEEGFLSSGSRQIRGKKHMPKSTTINVHLLKEVRGYGPAGSFVPVRPGIMRNIWYPSSTAEYLTETKIQELGIQKDAVIERDALYTSEAEMQAERRKVQEAREIELDRIAAERAVERAAAEAAAKDRLLRPDHVLPIEIEMLNPEQSTVILEKILPRTISFPRAPIVVPEPKRVALSPSVSSQSSISAAAASVTKAPTTTNSKVSIYGSVSTLDVATKIKEILLENEEGVGIALDAKDIAFVEKTEEPDRVKHLGTFEIEIQLDGATNGIRRKVKVVPEE